jgi:FixJ family two-component response regulator
MSTVYVVDDDEAMCESLRYLLQAEGYHVEHDLLGQSALSRTDWRRPACLVIDLRLADQCGLELRRKLRERGIEIPTIMISGRAEIPDAVRAVKDGVLDFLTKPFDDRDLIARVRQAIAQDAEMIGRQAELEALQARFAKLTRREHEVMLCVLAGRSNKQIAAELDLSAKTVEFHRKNVMRKIAVASVPALVRLAAVVFPELTHPGQVKRTP